MASRSSSRLYGGNDALDQFTHLQITPGKRNRACSFHSLGAGARDQPEELQSFESAEKVLTGVLDHLGRAPTVVLGARGLEAARFWPGPPGQVKGVV
ncbi:hypothetical protein [Amycolatopsis sp. NPDC051903]|uniref:hypothetical protein n=1 Tax=Amycolatopsis sp. NPDC051903 TaxID=3363936 RepID=UPI003795FBA1